MLRKELVVLSFMALTGFCMVSCSKDDDHTENKENTETEQKEIALTESVAEVGVTYAIVSGQVQLQMIPAGSTLKRVCFDLSTDMDFGNGQTKRYEARGIEGNRLTLTIGSLTPQTTYYYRIVVELNNLDFYGAKQTFTTKELSVTSSAGEVSKATFTSAILNFDVTSGKIAKSEDVVVGTAYSANKRYLQADSIMKLISRGYDYGIMNIGGLGLIPERHCSNLTDRTVNALIDGLEPGHTYYYCTYVRAGNNLIMNEVKSFATADFHAQQLMTCETSDVTLATATVTGSTTMTSTLAEMYPDNPYLLWGISYAPAASSSSVETTVPFNGNQFVAKLSGLTPNTNYVYRPFVNINGTVLTGEVNHFTTKPIEDYVTFDIDEIGFTTAKASGKTKLKGLFQNLSYTLSYRYDTDDYSWDNGKAMTVEGNELSAELSGLSCGRTYNCWLTVVADGQKLQTKEKTFTSLNPKDYITLSDATAITSSSAEVTCSVDPKVYANPTISCHIIYGPSKENISQYAQGTVDKMTMKAKMSNLTSGMTYYYYAQVLFTTGLGRADWYTTDIKSFTTK